MEQSVFELLRQILWGNKSYLQPSYREPINRLRNSRLDSRLNAALATEDIGRKIEEEFDRRYGYLEDWEKSAAMRYFEMDYKRAQNSAVYCLSKAQIARSGPKRCECLNLAMQLANIALQNVKRAMKISPESTLNGESYTKLLENIERLRDRIRIVLEFPDTFNQLIPLYLKLKEAVRTENYEFAAQLRDKIRQYTASYRELR